MSDAQFPFPVRQRDFWFDSALAQGAFPTNRDYATFSFGLNAVEDCVAMSVIQVVVPFSYFVIDTTNNQMQFTLANGNKYLLRVTPGTYTKQTLATQMALDLQANVTVVTNASGTALTTDLRLVYYFAVLVDDTTTQLLIYQTTKVAAFSVQFPDSSRSLQEVLGFAGATSSSSFASSSGVTYRNDGTVLVADTHYLYSPYLVQLSGPNYLTLHSDLGSMCHEAVIYPGRTNVGDAVENIEVNANYQATVSHQPHNPRLSMLRSQSSISSCTFYFTLDGRTEYTHYDAAGTATIRNHLSFQGASFLVGVRFYCSSATSIPRTIMNSLGDKIQEAHSLGQGGKTPHENRVNRDNVLKRQRGAK